MTDLDQRPVTTSAAATPRANRLQLARRLVAEGLGTALLLAVVVGSGIYAERLSTDAALQLLENSIATGAGLTALILAFGSVSGRTSTRSSPLPTACSAGSPPATPSPALAHRSSAAASARWWRT